jgi:hypothetical protein
MVSGFMNKRCLQLFGVALCSLFVAGAAGATTITVQSTGDGPANAANCPGASCRLRDAIAAANDGDTINFNLPANSNLAPAACGSPIYCQRACLLA